MDIIFYKRPYGRTEIAAITEIRTEDAEFFEVNNIRVSMEDLGGQYAIYADTGRKDEDGEPVELLVLSNGRSCVDCMNELRKLVQAELVLPS